MLPVLGSATVANIVGVCDSILYKAISGVLMPTVLQALPDRWALLSSPRGWALASIVPASLSLSIIVYHREASPVQTVNTGLLKILEYK